MLSKIDNMIAEKKIKSMSANIAGQLSIPEITIHNWMKELFPVLKGFFSIYGNRQIALIISNAPLPIENTEKFDTTKLWEFVSKGIECFQIDMALRFGLTELKSSEIVDVSDYCYRERVAALHVLGEDSQLYNIEGRAVAFYNFVHPEVDTRNRTGLR